MHGNATCEPKKQAPAYEIMLLAQELQEKMENLSERTTKTLEPIMVPIQANVGNEKPQLGAPLQAYPPYFDELRVIFTRINERITQIHEYLIRAELE